MVDTPDYQGAISGIESGGNYGILGPVTSSGDRAYGKYQIMGANIPQWTQQYYGQSLTPQQFLQNQDAQDKVFNGRFGYYVNKYGPEGAARAWFAGERGMNNPNAADVNGMTAQRYGQRFMAGLGSQAPLVNGPQQSYANASTLQASNDGVSGQAGRMESSYNNSPYNPGPQGTVSNTGQPAGPPQAGSQGELAGQGGMGWNIYQTTPTWTGSPLSQSPDARDESDFRAPPLSGPQNPLLQRQMAMRQAILQRAMQNIPRGYQFKLG